MYRNLTLSGSDPERPAYALPSRLRCPCRAFNRRHATATPRPARPWRATCIRFKLRLRTACATIGLARAGRAHPVSCTRRHRHND